MVAWNRQTDEQTERQRDGSQHCRMPSIAGGGDSEGLAIQWNGMQ